ncbi:MAG: DMT family transporter [Rhodoferax sp.]|nr:DMT family transporter [Rhodoferax sp.]
MSTSMACFLINDALVKHLSQGMPAAQLICIRGILATLLLLAIAQAMGLLRRAARGPDKAGPVLLHPLVLWRSALDALATMAYLNSLFHLPIANATAINMASPLFLTLYAMLRWREHVRRSRWLAIGVGFTGVLLVVQPTASEFNSWALVCLLATLLHTARDLVTRSIPAQLPSILVTLATALSVTLLSGVWATWSGWQAINLQQFGLLAAASVFLSAGYYLVIVGMRGGDMAVVAPFRYTGLLFALVLGWAFWGDIPNTMAWAGTLVLVGAGVFMLRSNRT